MQDFEKLGAFYLGRLFDVERGAALDDLLLYDSRDLVTHAVCVGMTGSGKTGLCVGLIEEAAIDGIPSLVIDPKGDLSNLLLTFPQLRPADFLPWVNESEARNQGIEPQELAEQQAALWKKGLAEWGQDGERIERLKASAEFAIYTPASNAGRPVSILKSFAAPPPEVAADREAMRDRVASAASSLLGLLGMEADPVRSREHILLSTLLHQAWKAGADLDLPALIKQIRTPPVTRVGVLDLEAFYPAKERFELAMALNNLLASPGFEAWLEGEALDVSRMMYTAEGKPRVAIFSIAHLSDAERMFFVSLLLNETLTWMRAQPGTTSLRALLYMDEIFGYFPPVANPPSKLPLLTLLKQARAFGLGVVLATQNPVDLDYKGLSNTGTWFIGRLQTERDKARVLDGLEGASAGAGGAFDRRRLDRLLSSLGGRTFLLHNVHEDAPVAFRTRWTLSYLRGPMTREQIQAAAPRDRAPEAAGAVSLPAAGGKPVLPPDVPQTWLPLRVAPPAGATLVYRPMLLGAAQVNFVDLKRDVEVAREAVYLASIGEEPVPVNWDESAEAGLAVDELEQQEPSDARYAALPAAAARARHYAAWTRDFTGWLPRGCKLTLLRSDATGLLSRPGEEERDFRIRLQQTAREERDDAVEKLRLKYAPKLAVLNDRLRRARQALERESDQAKSQKMDAALSFGSTLLGALFGRKTFSSGTISSARTAARAAGRISKEQADVRRAGESVEAVEQQLADLEAQFTADSDRVRTLFDPLSEPLETAEIRLKKTNIAPRLVALAWAPYWQRADGQFVRGW